MKRRIDNTVHLSFKDILLVPYDNGPVDIKSRKHPNISTHLSKNLYLRTPILSAPMDCVTGFHMAQAMYQMGGLGVITRFISDENEIEKQIEIVRKLDSENGIDKIACAVGVYKGDKEKIHKHALGLIENGCNVIVIDVQNGNHEFVKAAIETIKDIGNKYPITLIAGNVASGKAAVHLARYGVDVIKIGIGSGAACTTRRITGFGFPQLTAIMDCAEKLENHGYTTVKLISDGGIRNTGDIVKSLWAGADAVMCGYLFAGHDESLSKDEYRGMSSQTVNKRLDVAAEGVKFPVSYKGSVINTMTTLFQGIQSGFAMANAMNIEQLRENVRAIRVSTMSEYESEPLKE